jgi:hypothetical protein
MAAGCFAVRGFRRDGPTYSIVVSEILRNAQRNVSPISRTAVRTYSKDSGAIRQAFGSLADVSKRGNTHVKQTGALICQQA